MADQYSEELIAFVKKQRADAELGTQKTLHDVEVRQRQGTQNFAKISKSIEARATEVNNAVVPPVFEFQDEGSSQFKLIAARPDGKWSITCTLDVHDGTLTYSIVNMHTGIPQSGGKFVATLQNDSLEYREGVKIITLEDIAKRIISLVTGKK